MRRRKIVETLVIEHKGKEIVYDEGQNTWRCNELSLSAPTLKALRGQIDRFNSNERKVNVPAYVIERHWYSRQAQAKKVVITILCDGNDKGECWIREADGSREKARIDNLAPISEKSAVDAWMAAEKESEAAQKRAEVLKGAIPRFDEDGIMLANKEQQAQEAGTS